MPITPTRLRCEYLTDPLGIDEAQPRLSWVLESADRGQRQTAYQVIVASSAELLDADGGDLWESGKVPSDQSIHIVYAGAALQSRRRCWWKVRVWDREGRKGHPPPVFARNRFRPSLYGKRLYGILSLDVYGRLGTAAFGGVRHQIVTTRSPRDVRPSGVRQGRRRLTCAA